MNVLLPSGLEAADISGWDARRLGFLDASHQISISGHLELARRSRRRLGKRLTLIEPVEPDEARGFAFYDVFLDRRRWPDLMRRGYDAAVEALAPFRARPRGARRPAAKRGAVGAANRPRS
jgi:hypothetical protein